MRVGFENLDVWQRSVALSVEIYKHFRDNKDFGFKDQITRSSLSIPSNISEGYERKSIKEKNHFYSIAKGSAGELWTQISVGDNNYTFTDPLIRYWIRRNVLGLYKTKYI